jgi:WhiB family redox-sensing transcriptional regulator
MLAWSSVDAFEKLLASEDLRGSRAEWQRDALCREFPETDFFPERGESATQAKAICARCAVQTECLAYAESFGAATFGIWAGTSERERRRRHNGWPAVHQRSVAANVQSPSPTIIGDE